MICRLLIAILLTSSAAWATTSTTVTATIQSPNGSSATSGYVEFRLQPQNSSVLYHIAGSSVIAPQTARCTISGSGTLSSCHIWGNDTISPANTSYDVVFAPNGVVTQTVRKLLITGVSYNLANPVFTNEVTLVPQYQTIMTEPISVNLLPAADSTYTVGQQGRQYASGYFRQLFLNGYPLTVSPIIFDVTSYGAIPDDTNDDGLAIGRAAAALQANGGGQLYFPPGTYYLFSTGTTYPQGNWGWAGTCETVAAFSGISNIVVSGRGATLTVQGSWPYTPSPRYAQVFLFENCKNITIDGFNGTAQTLSLTTGVFHGVTLADFRQGCEQIEIPYLKLSDYACAVRTQRESDAADSNITKGIHLGYIDTTLGFYAYNGIWSGSDLVADFIRAEEMYRTFFIYGTENIRARVVSHNSIGSTDVSMSSYAGIALKNVDIDYTNHDSTLSTSYNGVRCVYLEHNLGPLTSAAGEIKNIHVRLDVKYNTAGGGKLGHAFAFSKVDDSGVADVKDRGHVLDGLTITGLVDGESYSTLNPIFIGADGEWGVTPTPSADTLANITLRDLKVVNSTHTAPISLSNVMKDVIGTITLDHVSSPTSISLWGLVATPLISESATAKVSLAGVTATNLDVNTTLVGVRTLAIGGTPVTIWPVLRGFTIANTDATGSVTYNLPAAVPGDPITFIRIAAEDMVIAADGTDTIEGNPTLTLSSAYDQAILVCKVAGTWIVQ